MSIANYVMGALGALGHTFKSYRPESQNLIHILESSKALFYRKKYALNIIHILGKTENKYCWLDSTLPN